ncbi:hypothetical protein GOODEAATRI_021247 [Goodea atripinnis]|uniref:Uncharacterized protein n=1 Tax=Goodea atripinnis TaxID=208336 RepID=A0ABV0P6P7_9TELE
MGKQVGKPCQAKHTSDMRDPLPHPHPHSPLHTDPPTLLIQLLLFHTNIYPWRQADCTQHCRDAILDAKPKTFLLVIIPMSLKLLLIKPILTSEIVYLVLFMNNYPYCNLCKY